MYLAVSHCMESCHDDHPDAKNLRATSPATTSSWARRGQHVNGPAAYGWSTEGRELLPVAEELVVLALLIDLRGDGLRQSLIATVLNAEGHRTREGATWSQPVVSRVLGASRLGPSSSSPIRPSSSPSTPGADRRVAACLRPKRATILRLAL